MGLEFLGHKDAHGAAVYFLSDGTHHSSTDMETRASQLRAVVPQDAQVLVFDGRRGDGQKICHFYAITTLPAVIIVMDDDQLYHSWYGVHLPTTDELRYMLGQSGVRLHGDQSRPS